jgi:lysyl-tRNA synthetase class I
MSDLEVENVTVTIDPHEVELDEMLNGMDNDYGMDIEIYQTVHLDTDQVRQLLEMKINWIEQYSQTQSTMATRYCELKNKAEAEANKLHETLRQIQEVAYNEEMTNEAALDKIQDLISDYNSTP